MTNRQFRLLLGATVLACIYFDQYSILAGVVAYLFFEGFTGWRMTEAISRLRGVSSVSEDCCSGFLENSSGGFAFDAERMMSLLAALMLGVALFVFNAQLWWLAWFIGFAQLGAGISGVCPMLVLLRTAGFK